MLISFLSSINRRGSKVKRSVFLGVLVLAVLVGSSVLQSESFFYPGPVPSDDGKFNVFGPMTQNLTIKPYASQEAEYEAFKAGDVDFMDSPLTATQLDELNSLDPDMAMYARAPINDSEADGAYAAGWEKVVNENGTGPWNYFTFLNTYKAGADSINWGFSNDIANCNPISSTSTWDWNLLNLIYDPMIRVNPYNASGYLPWLAQSWTIGTWYNPWVGECSAIEFKLREDVYWQDLEPNPTRSTPNGAPLLRAGATNVRFWGRDVWFTFKILKNSPGSLNYPLVSDVVYCDWYGVYTIKLYMDSLFPESTLLALFGKIPIVPCHVWTPIYREGTIAQFDPIAQQCVVGIGPWMFDYSASVMHSQYVLHANTRFFRYHPVDVTISSVQYKVNNPGTDVTFSIFLQNDDVQRDPIAQKTFILYVVAMYQNGSIETLLSCTNPELAFGANVLMGTFTRTAPGGFTNITAIITDDPLTGHRDQDGYTARFWGTIPEDISLDFFVNAKDAALLGAAFGSSTTSENWDPSCEINRDGFIGAKDAVKLGAVFGWHAY